MWHKVKFIWRVIVYFYDRYCHDHCASRAASLAYSTLLSIVPLMMVSFSVLSLFPVFKGAGLAIQEFILTNFVATSANVISQHLSGFANQLRVLSPYSLGFLALASILMIYNMVTAFNAIWHVKLKSHFAFAFLIYLIVLLITPILFGLLLLMSSYLASLPLVVDARLAIFLKKPFIMVMPYVAAFVTFTFFNWLLPSAKVRLWHAVVAGLITTLFFELAKYGFAVYLSYVPTYRLIYGALATIPLFLVWMYVSWMIVLIGALICNVMSTGLPDNIK